MDLYLVPEGVCVQQMLSTVLSTVCTDECVAIWVFCSQIFSFFFSFFSVCGAMNQPLQVSAECTYRMHAFTPLETVAIQVREAQDEDDQTLSWDLPNNGNQSSCDQAAGSVCNWRV